MQKVHRWTLIACEQYVRLWSNSDNTYRAGNSIKTFNHSIKGRRLLVRFNIHIPETVWQVWKNLHLVEDRQSISKLESELRQVKEQLRNAEDSVAYLSDRVATYRYRWLEEYYRAENLDHYMPPGTYVPDLPQIADGVPSPSTSFDFLEWDEVGEGSEQAARENISCEGVKKD